jgi:hypothetical protein
MSSSNPTPSSGSTPAQPAKKNLSNQTTAPRPNQTAAYWSAFVVAFVLFLVFALGHLPIPALSGFRSYGLAMRYIAFPLFAFLISACANVVVQQMTCGHINAGEIFFGAAYFLLPLYGGLLAGTSAYLRAPIASLGAMDGSIRGIFDFERRNELVLGFGKAYWIFFGAFIGQVLAGSMSAVC